MRKPKGSRSRAPSVCTQLQFMLDGGTFTSGRGFWRGAINEPVVIIHSSISRWTIYKASKILKEILRFIQTQLKQQAVYLEINGKGKALSVVSDDAKSGFPVQTDFDDDLDSELRSTSNIPSNIEDDIADGRMHYWDYRNSGALDIEDAMAAKDKFHSLISNSNIEYDDPISIKNDQKLPSIIQALSNIQGLIIYAEKMGHDIGIDENEKTEIWEIIASLVTPDNFGATPMSTHEEYRIRSNIVQNNLRCDEDTSNVKEGLDSTLWFVHVYDHKSPRSLGDDPYNDIMDLLRYCWKGARTSNKWHSYKPRILEVLRILNDDPDFSRGTKDDIQNLMKKLEEE